MDTQSLLELCESAEVKHLSVDQFLWKQGEGPHSSVYVLREGALHIYGQEGEQLILLETHDEGDVVGLRPLISGDNYAAAAKAEEESIIYAFDIKGLEKVMEENTAFSNYLLRTFAALARSRYDINQKPKIFLHHDQKIPDDFPLIEVQTIQTNKEPVTCKPNDSILFATQLMSKRNVGSMLVTNEYGCPLGIFTDRDLRHKIASNQFDPLLPVSSIMVSPVITVPPDTTVANVQILLVKHKIHHLCVTNDGSMDTPIIGVISDHDLLVIQANNPAILIREIRRAKTGSQLATIRDKAEILLKKYIYQEVSIMFISTILSEINDALIIRANQLAEETLAAKGVQAPKVKFCWLGLGSEGRREQLLRTDQDNALIFEDVAAEKEEAVKMYFLKFAKIVTGILNKAGFEYCPANMMASNPQWCLPLKTWKKNFSHWINSGTSESLLHANIFFDYRPIYGSTELSEQLTDFIYEELEDQKIFFSRLAKNAQENPPPLTFFRNFVVEPSGVHKDKFDIKARAMMPLTDAARVLTLQNRFRGVNNTVRRYQQMAEIEPQNAEIYHQAADAYEIFMRYRALQGLKDMNSGRYFDPAELNKLERMNLRNSFKPIQEIQSLIKVRFQTTFLD